MPNSLSRNFLSTLYFVSANLAASRPNMNRDGLLDPGMLRKCFMYFRTVSVEFEMFFSARVTISVLGLNAIRRLSISGSEVSGKPIYNRNLFIQSSDG